MGKHSNGRARSGREAADEAPAAAQPSAVAVDDAPAPVAFSGWLPPPAPGRVTPVVAERAAPVAPQPVVFSAAPSPLEVMAAPVSPVSASVQATVPSSVPAAVPSQAATAPDVPALAEAFAAVASGTWFVAAEVEEPPAHSAVSALELLATSTPTPSPRPAPVLDPLPEVFDRPSQLVAAPVQAAPVQAAPVQAAPVQPSVEAEPESAPEPDLPPVPQFRADASATTKAPDVVTPGEETQRELAKARRTRKIGKAGGIAILCGALIAGGVVGIVGYRSERPKAHARAAALKPVRTQRTLLFALGDPTGDEAALLAADPKAGTSTVTLLPSRVVTTVVGQGQLPLGRAVALGNAEVASGSISDLLGVDVDASWRVTPTVLAQLIDSVGGITADVDVDIVSNGVVIIRAGAGQHLGGTDAVAYAQYLAQGEDETARLARLQRVLAGFLAALPAQDTRLSAGRLTSLLGALGAGSESSLAPAALASQLLTVEAGNKGVAVPGPAFSILPVTTLDSGGSTTAYRIDPVAMASYVAANLAASVPSGARAGGIRVFVYSGTLEYGVGTAARKKLVDAGLSFVGSDNEAAPSDAPSVVLVADGTDASRAQGLRVARALGLPASSIEVSNLPQTVADVIVIAGGDFRY